METIKEVCYSKEDNILPKKEGNKVMNGQCLSLSKFI